MRVCQKNLDFFYYFKQYYVQIAKLINFSHNSKLQKISSRSFIWIYYINLMPMNIIDINVLLV